MLNRVKEKIGIDKSIAYSLVKGLWVGFSNLGTIYLITKLFTPISQGYYYTFYSLIALQVFVEMGLNFAVAQFVSHEVAHLTIGENGVVSGNEQAKKRLQSVIKFSFYWFGVGAVILSIGLIPIGYILFSNQADIEINLMALWTILVVINSMNLLIIAATTIIEGAGGVLEIIGMKFHQSIISTLALWIFIILDFGLYSIIVSSTISFVFGVLWIFSKKRIFFIDIYKFRSKLEGINWKSEILPFQWKIAASWISGYFIFQFFTPLLFKESGPVIAGQFGATMQLFSIINGGAIIWISTKMPLFGKLIAKKQIIELDSIFFKSLKQSIAILIIGLVIGGIMYIFLYYRDMVFIKKLLPYDALLILSITSIINHIVFSMAYYLRAHKEEPFLVPSILNALLIVAISVYLVPRYSYMGAVVAYFLGSLIMGLGVGGIIFHYKRLANL
jgi:hypothetical protein